MTQKITILVAIADNGVIGANNEMIWHLPEDLAFFKQYTLNKPVIMGRKTWESLPKKPLPQRQNIIISRQQNFDAEGALVCSDMSQALALCADAEEIIVMGGAQIYELFLPIATDFRLTRVHIRPDGDAFFPQSWDLKHWKEISRQSMQAQIGVLFEWVHMQRICD